MKYSFLRSVVVTSAILVSVWAASAMARGQDMPPSKATAAPRQSLTAISIPGPRRSFLRMAAISQNASADEIIPLLAHNAALQGYTYTAKGKKPTPTEYLILLKEYVKQARELRGLAGPLQVIRISSCDQAGPLLKILGYELTRPCGPETSIQTSDSARAFVTDNSGFPLTSLEQTLRGGEPFEYGFGSFRVPALFSPGDWEALDPNDKDDLLDAVLSDARLARLYWALAQVDRRTRDSLLKSPGLKKLLPLAPVLDFYGGQIMIQAGRVVVPGGQEAEPTWTKLVGASPDSPGEFVVRLLEKDEGWLAAFFDALLRADSRQQAYLTRPDILESLYKALIGRSASPGAARPVFRPDAGLVLLMSRLKVDAAGRPFIPGGLAVWKQVLADFQHQNHSRLIRERTTRAETWNTPEGLLGSLVALSRSNLEYGPLQAYLSLSAMDWSRQPENRLKPETVRLLADNFAKYGDQYLTFSEFPLSNASITLFIRTADAISGIHDRNLRADSLGIFQAEVGLWKILARQGEIPADDRNQSWQGVINPFPGIGNSAQLYQAARLSIRQLSQASAGRPDLSQSEFVDLLAGPEQATESGRQARVGLANKITLMMAAQRLVSLDTLFKLGDGLELMAGGKTPPADMVRLAAQLREFQLPKPLFTRGERAEWSMGIYSNEHIQTEMQTNLAKFFRGKSSPGGSQAALGDLVPFLRDTLVGLNYAYYEPPGAQMIFNNSLYVRSHDFVGESRTRQNVSWRTADLFGRGLPASGGVHLVGSLASLPYVLAQVEENFIVPNSIQSLIWEDLVPTLVTGAVLPRWWHVTSNELHAVALYQEFGEDLVRASATNPEVRQRVMDILFSRMLPRRFEQVEMELHEGRSNDALNRLTPGETFWLAIEFRRKFPSADSQVGEAEKQLNELARKSPDEVSWKRLSSDFGVPHPVLADTDALSLIGTKPFPTYLGYSSRLLAESWDSNNLYWARLADEKGYPPVMLNLLVPQLTYRMVENISATYLDDWPALIQSLRETGREFQQGKVASLLSAKGDSGF
jgi:hypothetical protein